MSSHTIKPVKLQYSRPLKKQKIVKKYKNYRALNKGRRLNNEILPKPIHAYRMWYLFLKLALELEQQNTELIMKRPIGKAIVSRQVKVNKKKYEGWDLDQVLTLNFNDWWKTHRHIFNDEITKTLNDSDTASNSIDHLTVQIDLRMRINDIVDSVTQAVKDNKRKRRKQLTKIKPKFTINGNIHKTTVLNRYNCLLLKLENKLSNKEIITHSDGYIRDCPDPQYDVYGNKDYSRLVYGFISGTGTTFGAKQILLSVCDGYFLKHPSEDYL